MTNYDYRQFDPLVHSRIRLSVLAILVSVDDAEFTYLRKQVKATDGNLAAHLRRLEEAGYLHVAKHFVDRKPLTRYRVTETGREAFRRYVDSVEQVLRATPSELPRSAAG
ncbi:MAG: transcriptional regulator [Gemmatimonadetes bacterium]|nr:transcriptional regulator [Gemmatimonadota bacterium]MYG35287.1 transcriptional regulator [Gemmatimonadota bacterium]